MALDFPSSPAIGDTHNGPNGVVWVWDGIKWAPSVGPGAASSAPIVQDTPPVDAPPDSLWWCSADGQLYINYDDGNSVQWVATTSSQGGAAADLTPAMHNVGRNLLHNGLFNITQRGTGPFTIGGAFSADRWRQWIGATDTINTVINGTDDATRAQVGDEACQQVIYSTFTGGSAADDLVILQQNIECVRRLSGKTVTVSFWVVGNAGAKLGVSIDQWLGDGMSPPEAGVIGNGQSITLNGDYVLHSMTFVIPSVAVKALGTAGTDITQLSFWLSAGSNYTARAGGVGVQTGGFAIWGVQLEIGSVATPLEKPDPHDDLARCQRFYFSGAAVLAAYQAAAGGIYAPAPWPVKMRASPVVTTVLESNDNVGAISWIVVDGQVVAFANAQASGGFVINTTFTASADL